MNLTNFLCINFGTINRITAGNYESRGILGYLELGIASAFSPWLVKSKFRFTSPPRTD